METSGRHTDVARGSRLAGLESAAVLSEPELCIHRVCTYE